MHTKVFNEKVEGKGIWILYTPWVITSFLFNFSHFLNNVWHYKIDIFMATLETNGPPKILSYLQTIPYAYIIYGYGYSQISLFFYFYKNKSKWSILWRGTILWLKSVTFSIYTYLDRNWTLEFVANEGRPRYEKMLISFNFSTTAVGGHGQAWCYWKFEVMNLLASMGYVIFRIAKVTLNESFGMYTKTIAVKVD